MTMHATKWPARLYALDVLCLMKPDTFRRDNIVNHRGVTYGAKRSYKQYPKEFKEEAVAFGQVTVKVVFTLLFRGRDNVQLI